MNRLRSELRKAFSVRLWWALLLPVAVLSGLVNVFGGLFADALGAAAAADGGPPPLLLASLAYALALTSVFAVVHGIVAAAGEFRHRTVTTTYLLSGGRGPVLAAASAAGALVGGLYAAVAVLVGVPAGLAGGGVLPGAGDLLTMLVTGIAVCALWGAVGVALGVATGNQAGALAGTLVYLLLGELLLSALLNDAEAAGARRIAAYLPGNAADVALYDVPARALGGPELGPGIVEGLAGVTAPPSGWAALLVLGAWTATAAATAWWAANRRDVS